MQEQLRVGEDGDDWLAPLLPHCKVLSTGVHSECPDASPSEAAQVLLLHGGQVQELDHVPCREGYCGLVQHN